MERNETLCLLLNRDRFYIKLSYWMFHTSNLRHRPISQYDAHLIFFFFYNWAFGTYAYPFSRPACELLYILDHHNYASSPPLTLMTSYLTFPLATISLTCRCRFDSLELPVLNSTSIIWSPSKSNTTKSIGDPKNRASFGSYGNTSSNGAKCSPICPSRVSLDFCCEDTFFIWFTSFVFSSFSFSIHSDWDL